MTLEIAFIVLTNQVIKASLSKGPKTAIMIHASFVAYLMTYQCMIFKNSIIHEYTLVTTA